MKLNDIKKEFLRTNKDWILEHINDLTMINYEYNAYLDGLCKDGVITQKQWNNHSGFTKNYIKNNLF